MIKLTDIQVRIVQAVKESGLTQTEIARRLNISGSSVSYYVKGINLPVLDTLANFCAVLDLDANYILCLVN